jgi:hypothetical protein
MGAMAEPSMLLTQSGNVVGTIGEETSATHHSQRGNSNKIRDTWETTFTNAFKIFAMKSRRQINTQLNDIVPKSCNFAQ